MPRPQARVADETNVRQQKEGSSNRDWTFPENSITYFYLFPPWGDGVNVNPRNLLAREVREIFFGKGKGSWTCWMSYQLHPKASPDIGRKDLVTDYIFNAYRDSGKADFIKSMLPNRKYYANILLESFTPLGSDGSVGELQRFDDETWNKVTTARIPVGVYRSLMEFAMDKRLGAPFYLPEQAAMIAVKRTGKDLETEYKTQFAEGEQQQGLFVPIRHDLYQDRGEAVIVDLLGDPVGSNLPDLDTTEYPFPGDLAKMQADALDGLKLAKLAIAGGGADTAPGGIEGAAPAPEGIQYGPPPAGAGAPGPAPTGPAPMASAPPVGAPPGPAQAPAVQPAAQQPAPAAQPQAAPPAAQQPAPAVQPQPAVQPAPAAQQPAAQQPAAQQPAPAPQQPAPAVQSQPQPVGPPAQVAPVQTAPPPTGPPPVTVAAPGLNPPQPMTPAGMAPGAGLPQS